MRKSLILYFKFQLPYLIFLLGIFVIPLGLFYKFSTYQLPKVQYVILAVLVLSQYFFFKEKIFRRKIEDKMTEHLKNELQKVPSRKEIIERSSTVIQYRGINIALSSLSIFLLMVLFNKF